MSEGKQNGPIPSRQQPKPSLSEDTITLTTTRRVWHAPWKVKSTLKTYRYFPAYKVWATIPTMVAADRLTSMVLDDLRNKVK